MKVIIAGSRSIREYFYVEEAVKQSGFFSEEMEVVSGTAYGVDKLGEKFAENHGLKIHRFPAEWNIYGRYAGNKRNREMAEFADALIAIWDGESTGTKDMITHATNMGLKIFVLTIPKHNLFQLLPEFTVGE